MPELEKRALYNLLRMNWSPESKGEVEPWQVEEYRNWPLERLFSSLNHLGISISRENFCHYSDECDTPEELVDLLIDEELSPQEEDRIYLLIFELWRRLEPDRPSLSIFCDEFDHWINLYDREAIDNPEKLQDLIDNFQELLDENVDAGGDPVTIFHSFQRYAANDLESFLYDYIAQQLDDGDWSYAADLLDGFHDYLSDSPWIAILNIRLWSHVDEDAVEGALEELVEECCAEREIDLNIELLDLLSKLDRNDLFITMARETIDLLESEADFCDLIEVSIDFCHERDLDARELEKLLKERRNRGVDRPFAPSEKDLSRLFSAIELKEGALE